MVLCYSLVLKSGTFFVRQEFIDGSWDMKMISRYKLLLLFKKKKKVNRLCACVCTCWHLCSKAVSLT